MKRGQKPSLRAAAIAAAAILIAWAPGCAPISGPAPSRPGDWIEVEGESAIHPLGPHGKRRAEAVEAAERDARRKIREHFAVAEVSPGLTVLQAMERDGYVWSKVLGSLEATRSHEQIEEDRERIKIRMRVDMNLIRDICLRKEAAPGPGETP
jgi:hypothetical protein